MVREVAANFVLLNGKVVTIDPAETVGRGGGNEVWKNILIRLQ
jgi:hypothetical protein